MDTFRAQWKRMLVACAVFLAAQSGWAESVAVGQVLFAIGDARIHGGSRPLAKGDAIAVGQTIVTGSSGHVHIRFIDQAFVSVRPDTQLSVDEYLWDQAAPQNNRVKFSLFQGTSRLITGQAGQANKAGFRLNTPVAAIGVRGTDFVVNVTSEATKVTVQQGAIVMSPFGDNCSLEALGPCGGLYARQLTSQLSGGYLELNKGQGIPVFVSPANSNMKKFDAPQPEEPPVQHSSANVSSGALGGRQVWWGRWGGGETALGANQEIVAKNEWFTLIRSTDNLIFPNTGVAKFRVSDSEAYLRNAAGNYQAAEVKGGALTVDFGQKTFSTSINYSSGGSEQALQAQGQLSDTGRFKVDALRSNMLVSGALAGNGSEAAYYFQKNFADQSKALGVVHWVR